MSAYTPPHSPQKDALIMFLAFDMEADICKAAEACAILLTMGKESDEGHDVSDIFVHDVSEARAQEYRSIGQETTLSCRFS